MRASEGRKMREDGIEIRRVKPGDQMLFDRVAEDVFDHAIDPKILVEYLAEPNHHLVVAIHEGAVIGQCAAVVHKHPDLRPTELYIDEVGVAPSYRRRGIARQMLDTMFAHGRALGCEEVWVGTENDNIAARNLYASRSEESEEFVMYEFKL
jgi:ribosomal protein S18 acetylase RimI-like enzyme